MLKQRQTFSVVTFALYEGICWLVRDRRNHVKFYGNYGKSPKVPDGFLVIVWNNSISSSYHTTNHHVIVNFKPWVVLKEVFKTSHVRLTLSMSFVVYSPKSRSSFFMKRNAGSISNTWHQKSSWRTFGIIYSFPLFFVSFCNVDMWH